MNREFLSDLDDITFAVFEMIAIGQNPSGYDKSKRILLDKGYIVPVGDRGNYEVTIPLHMQWSEWCAALP